MGRHDIGDYFKERMKGQHLDIDTDAVWNELGLEKKRKRRGLWWIWGLGSLVLIAGAYLAYEVTVTIGGDSREKQAELPTSPCLLYTSPSPRDRQKSRMPSSA